MIWLIGMMGAGKSAVGAAVARAAGLRHVDTDATIVERADATIDHLFETVGEPTFRLFEAAVVAELAAAGGDVVVSTGGGAILDDASVARMRESGCVVWLTAAPTDLAARVGDGAGRPLLAGDPDGALDTILTQRAPRYEAAAHHEVATAGREAAEIAAEVLRLCRPG